MKLFKDFWRGSSYVFYGICQFYRDRSAWKYCIFPVLLVVLIYALMFGGVFYGTDKLIDWLAGMMEQWPSYLTWLAVCIRTGLWIFSASIFFLLLASSFSALYELIGGFFFDALTDYYEKKIFKTTAAPFSWKYCIIMAIETVLYAVLTLCVLVVMLVLSFLLPMIGQVLLILVMGFFLGISCMISSASRNGVRLTALQAAALRNKALVWGFGVTAYLLLLIPFSVLFLLPGMLLGGAELRSREMDGK